MIENLLERGKTASCLIRNLSTEDKNNAIIFVSYEIEKHFEEILDSNKIDVEKAKANGTSKAMLDRLTLTKERITSITADMRKVAALPDYVGQVEREWTTESGLNIKKVRAPFGVIGIIYEARPNVTVDVFTLCLKTNNVCLLKGGSDAENTNRTIVSIIQTALQNTSVTKDAVILLPSDRKATEELIHAKGYVDLITPRGGKGLINYVVENSTIPVIETGAGVCHTYVDKTADLDEALKIVTNAKMSRPSVCNAMETLLVDREIAKAFLEKLSSTPNLTLRGGDEEKAQLSTIQELTTNGYYTEYGDYEMSVKIVNGVNEATQHINKYGTHHSDCIVSQNTQAIEYFMNNVDSACVYVNASTRFSDGGCFGFGAELGISTQKSHARGPIGLYEMTTYYYKIFGKGQVR